MPKPGEMLDDISVALKRAACPWCGYGFDAATHVGDTTARPSAGDKSICIQCGAVGVFTRLLTIRKPTKREARSIASNPNIQRAIQAWRDVVKKPKHSH
jgi:hypothetical protein